MKNFVRFMLNLVKLFALDKWDEVSPPNLSYPFPENIKLDRIPVYYRKRGSHPFRRIQN